MAVREVVTNLPKSCRTRDEFINFAIASFAALKRHKYLCNKITEQLFVQYLWDHINAPGIRTRENLQRIQCTTNVKGLLRALREFNGLIARLKKQELKKMGILI